jgi:hypothetical protein
LRSRVRVSFPAPKTPLIVNKLQDFWSLIKVAVDPAFGMSPALTEETT